MTANVYALVAAAGSGTRLGFDTPKAFVELNGRSLLERSLDGLAASQSIEEAIVLVSENMRDHAERIVSDPINVAEWAPMTVSVEPVSYTHLTLPTILRSCRSRWSPYH